MQVHRLALYVFLSSILLACQEKPKKEHQEARQKGFTNPLENPLDSLLHREVQKWMESPEKVGISIGIVHQGHQHYYHYGSTEKGEKKLPNNKTIYEIASLTKTFSGGLLAKAIAEGKMQLEADIRSYLEDDYPNLEFEGHFISIRDLINHRSGLPHNFPHDPKLWEKPDFDTLPYQLIALEKGITKEDWLRELKAFELTVIPGEIPFTYSNIGVNLAIIALENVYEKSYEDLLKAWILEPNEMNNTYLRLDEVSPEHLAKPYNQKGKEMPYLLDNSRAAGGLKSSIGDMLAYVDFQLDEKNEIPRLSQQKVWEQEEGPYSAGYFWQMLAEASGKRKIFQSGGAFGFSSFIGLFPEDKLGFIFLTNEAGPASQGALSEMADRVRAELIKE